MLGLYALGSAPLGSAGGGGGIASEQFTGLSATLTGGVLKPVSSYQSSEMAASVLATALKPIASDQFSGLSAALVGGAVRPIASDQFTSLSATLLQDQGGMASEQFTGLSATLTGGAVRPIAADQFSGLSATLTGGAIRPIASDQTSSLSATVTPTSIKSVSAYQSSALAATLTGGVYRPIASTQFTALSATLVAASKNYSLAIATQGEVVLEWQAPATYISFGSAEEIMVPLQIVEGNKAPKIITLYAVNSDTGYAALDLTGCSGYTARARKIDESTGYPAGASVAISATLYGAAVNGQIQLDYSGSGLTAGIWEAEIHFIDGAAYQHVYGPAMISVSEPIPDP